MRRLAWLALLGCGGGARTAPPPAPPVANQPAPAKPAAARTSLLGDGEMNGCFGYGRSGFGPGGGGCGATASAPPRDANPMQLGPVGVSSKPLAARAIREHLVGAQSRLQYCYEKALLTDPTVEGTVRATFTVTTTGEIAHAHADGTGSAELEVCIGGVLEAIEMPARPSAVDATASFTFTSRARTGSP